MKHQAHNELVAAVRSWYISPDEELGKGVQHRAYGFYSQIVGTEYFDVHVVDDFPAAQVPSFLADVDDYYNSLSVSIFIHEPEVDENLCKALQSAGCQRADESVYLAHVGAAPAWKDVSGLTVEKVTSDNVEEYVITKLKAFANCEDEPAPEKIHAGLALREAERASIGGFLIGRLGGEAAGIIGWYEGKDRCIFHLATRVPYRNQGVARYLLAHVTADSHRTGKRSTIIFTNPEDTPIQIYHRYGFTDKVYWMVKYQWR